MRDHKPLNNNQKLPNPTTVHRDKPISLALVRLETIKNKDSGIPPGPKAKAQHIKTTILNKEKIRVHA